MVENIKVPCPKCKGKGSYERTMADGHFVCYLYSNVRGCPISEHFCNPCNVCNGYGVLIATELKKVTAAEVIQSRDSGEETGLA